MIQFDDNKDGITLSSDTQTLPEYIKGTPPTIERLRRRFDQARDDDNNLKCQRDRDYFDGPKQLDSEVRTILKGRGQPPIYTNRVRPAVNGVLGVLEAGRRDPRALPRNPDDDDAADICTKTLRFINDESKFNDTQMDVAENFFIEGTGAVLVEVIDGNIVPTQIRWEEFYYDRYSRRADFKDARYMGIAKWMDADEVRERWQVRIDEIGDPMRPSGMEMFGGDKYEDVGDNGSGWINTKRRRVLLIEEYALEQGEWRRIVYIAAGVLEYGSSPYLDDKRRPCNPIEAASCYVDRENGRYGMVRDMIPIQDEINASRSRSLALMNARQITVEPNSIAATVDTDEIKREAAKHDGVLPAGATFNTTNDMTQANILRNQEAKTEIERMGPTPAVLGRQEGAGQSGRARLVSQQAGLTELARPLGRLHGWVLRVYEQMWFRAQQYWTDPMWIRVTDEVKAPEFIQVNEPVVGMVMQEMQQPDGSVVQMPTMGVVSVNNRLAELDVDLILDQDEHVAVLAQESYAELMQMVAASGLGLQAVLSPEFELAIEMNPNVPDKRRILERLKAAREERDQQNAQAQQAQAEAAQRAQQIGEAGAIADIQNKEADTLSKTANAHKTAAAADTEQAQLYAGLGLDPMLALQDNG